MVRVFLDIDIGDPIQSKEENAAYNRTVRFLDEVGRRQLGLDAEAPDELDTEGRALLEEAYETAPDKQGKLRFEKPRPLRAGRLVIETYPDQVPKTVENFRCLVTGEKGKSKASGKQLFYRGVGFHRILSGFVCQGGDFVRGDGSGGESIYGGKFNDEKAGLKLKHDGPGVVGMANSGKNSNSCQFYITLKAAPQLDGKHVVFGKVVEGIDLLDRIENEAATPDGKPRTPVTIAECGVL